MVTYLNGERYEHAHCWGVLKTKHYCRIYSEWQDPKIELEDRDYFKLFSILTDTDFKAFNSTAHNEVTIWNCVRWVVEQPTEYEIAIPRVLKINGKFVDIPERPELLSIGQNVQLSSRIAKMKDLNEGISVATAIFLQPLYDEEKFDIKKALKLKEVIDEMPAAVIWPIGFFLLSRAMKNGPHGSRSWSRIKDSLTFRLGKMLPGWLTLKGLSRSKVSAT